MLLQQNTEDPLWRNQTDECALGIHDCQAAFAVLNGAPGSDFLVDAGRHDRRVAIHDGAQLGILWRGQQLFDPHESEKATFNYDSHIRHTVELTPDDDGSNFPDPLSWTGDGNRSSGVLLGRARDYRVRSSRV
jgi:hypothetical protein